MPTKSRGNFINNAWIRPTENAEGDLLRYNPSHHDEVVFAGRWSTAAADDAVDAACNAQPDWDRLSLERRLGYIEKFRNALEKRQTELARAITLEMGKPLWEARIEAGALLAKIDIMTGEGLDVTAPVHPEGLSGGSWRHRPLGVLAVLGPYNFPLHLPNGHIIPALATGNTVVVKPSEVTPLSMQLYFECLQEAEFPAGVINLVQGPGAVGAKISGHPGVDGILFTGSYETGRKIKEAALDHPHKLLALEMGGKNTSIVLEDANLDQAAHAITQAACMTTGQRCSATSRVVVQADVFDEFVDRLRALFERVTSGDPFDEENETLMGPLATVPGFEDFVAAQDDDEDGNLRPILEGGAHKQLTHGNFVRPALWQAEEVDPKGSHQARELFGPDIVLYKTKGDREATTVANATDYGLAMSVFTADEDRFEEMSYDLQTGILNLNRSTAGASSRLPFGGVKKSGNHRPAAILAGRYCTYPMASLRVEPGFDQASVEEGPLSRLQPEDD